MGVHRGKVSTLCEYVRAGPFEREDVGSVAAIEPFAVDCHNDVADPQAWLPLVAN